MKVPYRYMTITLAAGGVQRVAMAGSYLRILSNSSATMPQISIQDAGFESIPAGVSIELPDKDSYRYVDFYNPSLANMTLEIVFSPGRVDDSRLTLTGTISTHNTHLVTAAGAAGTGRVAVSNGAGGTEIVAANSSRKSVMIRNLVTNTGIVYLWWNNTITSTKNFVELRPGEVWSNDDYAGSVYGLAVVNNEVVNVAEV